MNMYMSLNFYVDVKCLKDYAMYYELNEKIIASFTLENDFCNVKNIGDLITVILNLVSNKS